MIRTFWQQCFMFTLFPNLFCCISSKIMHNPNLWLTIARTIMLYLFTQRVLVCSNMSAHWQVRYYWVDEEKKKKPPLDVWHWTLSFQHLLSDAKFIWEIRSSECPGLSWPCLAGAMTKLRPLWGSFMRCWKLSWFPQTGRKQLTGSAVILCSLNFSPCCVKISSLHRKL